MYLSKLQTVAQMTGFKLSFDQTWEFLALDLRTFLVNEWKVIYQREK